MARRIASTFSASLPGAVPKAGLARPERVLMTRSITDACLSGHTHDARNVYSSSKVSFHRHSKDPVPVLSRPLIAMHPSYSCANQELMFFRTNFYRGLTTLAYRSTRQSPKLQFSGGDDDGHMSPLEYKVRVGKALSTLRDELPQFFQHGLGNTSIYASNVRLIEGSHTNVSMQGKAIYFLLAGAVRWSFKMWFRDLEFEIQSIRVNDRGGRGLKGLDSGGDFDTASTITRTSHKKGSRQRLCSSGLVSEECARTPQDSDVKTLTGSDPSSLNGTRTSTEASSCQANRSMDSFGITGNWNRGVGEEGRIQSPIPPTTVTVRWTLKGTTRPSVVLTAAGPTSPPPSSYEGIFVYQFNDFGLIDEHRIENIMPSPSPEAIQRAFAWWGWLISRPARPAAVTSSLRTSTVEVGRQGGNSD